MAMTRIAAGYGRSSHNGITLDLEATDNQRG